MISPTLIKNFTSTDFCSQQICNGWLQAKRTVFETCVHISKTFEIHKTVIGPLLLQLGISLSVMGPERIRNSPGRSQWQVFIPVRYGESCRHKPICCCCSWRSETTPSTKSGTGRPESIMIDLFQIMNVGTTGRRKEISNV